ncbi:GNAT family N-acetyltransferase [Coprobacter tertius]|uniref:GNAT family N-acetyltransferase n=1 Tax=Coprobacter tertius TaxID=2944915 RepID=A0ABT1MFT6_9BACT|nr:GNAT family N-acetyltransferase [Coprobacter tertius]MCP9611219.1 GNAT family N-acetyltransferase [Coprobacter tertius]
MDLRQQIIDLWQACFGDTEEFVQLYFSTKYSDENTLAIIEDDKVLSALQILPYTMTCWGKKYRASYISGASTWPEYREKGLMSRLIREAFITMRNREIPFSFLIPAEEWLYDYYAKSGYAPVFRKACEVYRDILPADFNVCGNTIGEYYAYFSSRIGERTCCIQHSLDDFKVILQELELAGGKVIAVHNNEKRIRGLAFALFYNNRILVKDWFYDDIAARNELLQLIRREFPKGDIFCDIPATVENNGYKRGMLRIVNVRRILHGYAKAFPQVKHVWRIIDDIIPQNNGIYFISNGKCMQRPDDDKFNTDDIYTVSELAIRLFPISDPPFLSLMLD